ncbi:MAG: MFS transporter [Chloroflexi bacterium]|nr:MFS transporter [Chloroflexota bacterium]
MEQNRDQSPAGTPPAAEGPRFLLAFRHTGYPWFWGNVLAVSSASTLEVMAQGWLVLEITDSPLWVGIAAGLRGLSTLLFSLPGGVLADRVDRRRLLAVGQGVNGLVALALAMLTLTGAIQLWHILVAAFLYGTVMAMLWPARNALVFDLVGRRALLNANAANFMAMSAMRIVSPLAGGLLIAATGVSSAYFLICTAYAIALGLLVRVPRQLGGPQGGQPVLGVLQGAIESAFRPGVLRSLLFMSLLTEVFGFSYHFMLPVMARDVLRVGASGLGLLTSAGGAGGLAATLLVASLGDVRWKGVLLVAAAAGFGLFLVLFAASPWFPLSLVLLGMAAAMAATYDTALGTLLQSIVPDRMRGRTMGLYVFTFGFTPLGGFQAGAIAGFLGAPIAIAVGGALVVANALRLLPLARQLGQVDKVD